MRELRKYQNMIILAKLSILSCLDLYILNPPRHKRTRRKYVPIAKLQLQLSDCTRRSIRERVHSLPSCKICDEKKVNPGETSHSVSENCTVWFNSQVDFATIVIKPKFANFQVAPEISGCLSRLITHNIPCKLTTQLLFLLHNLNI